MRGRAAPLGASSQGSTRADQGHEAAPEPKPEPKVAPEPAPKPTRATKAAKKAKRQDLAGTPIKVVKPSKLDPFKDKIGVLTDAEIAALAGVTVTNVYGYRLRHGIPAPPRQAKVAVEPAVQAPVPAAETVPTPAVAVVPEPVAVQLVGKPEIDTPVGTNVRTIRLTDRVEGMLQALAKVRGIDPDDAISVAIAEDYLRCKVLIRAE